MLVLALYDETIRRPGPVSVGPVSSGVESSRFETR